MSVIGLKTYLRGHKSLFEKLTIRFIENLVDILLRIRIWIFDSVLPLLLGPFMYRNKIFDLYFFERAYYTVEHRNFKNNFRNYGSAAPIRIRIQERQINVDTDPQSTTLQFNI